MNKFTGACFLLSMVLLLVFFASAEHKKPDGKLTRIDNVDGEMFKPLNDILGELEGLRVRRAAQGGSNGQGGQGGDGNGGRRGPPDGGQGQRGGQGGQGGQQGSAEN